MADSKINITEVDRSLYDFRDDESKDFYRMKEGLTRDIVEQISDEKNDPQWMREFRLKCLDLYNKMEVPNWGPSIEGLDMDRISSYVRSKSDMKRDWKDVPDEIKSAFDKLGIPQAERESLAGVGAQYDSELVYHNLQEDVAKQGVVYTGFEEAVTGEYSDMVKEYFMKLVPREGRRSVRAHAHHR